MTSKIIFTSCVTQKENVCVHQFNRMYFDVPVFNNVLLKTPSWPNFHYFEPAQSRRWRPSELPPFPTCSFNYSHYLKCVRLLRKRVNTGMLLRIHRHFIILLFLNRKIELYLPLFLKKIHYLRIC